MTQQEIKLLLGSIWQDVMESSAKPVKTELVPLMPVMSVMLESILEVFVMIGSDWCDQMM